MTEGRDRFTWSVASALMALIANCHSDERTEYDADDFNPTLTKKERHRNAILIDDDNIDFVRDQFKRAFM